LAEFRSENLWQKKRRQGQTRIEQFEPQSSPNWTVRDMQWNLSLSMTCFIAEIGTFHQQGVGSLG
jgi:hypothetical protein